MVKRPTTKVALVGQQKTAFMTLNQDIADDNDLDFAFTVQPSKNEANKSAAQRSISEMQDFNLSQAQTQNKTGGLLSNSVLQD